MDHATLIRSSLEATFRSVLGESLGKEAAESGDVGSIVQLCLMAGMPTGKEDPRALLAGISGRVLEHIVTHRAAMAANPALRGVGQFFLIEWHWRHGNLEEDWLWLWTGPSGGELLFKPKVPLDQVELPAPKVATTTA